MINEYRSLDRVKDLIPNDLKIVLVLESPAGEELEKGYPLAGRSGVGVGKVILNEERAFGDYISSNIQSCEFGIMNISQVPLDKKYIKNGSEQLIEYLNKIRKGYKYMSNHRKHYIMNDIEREILGDFSDRLSELLEKFPQVKLLVCGRFAEKYIENIDESIISGKDYECVKHPSYNNWIVYQEDIIYKINEFLRRADVG